SVSAILRNSSLDHKLIPSTPCLLADFDFCRRSKTALKFLGWLISFPWYMRKPPSTEIDWTVRPTRPDDQHLSFCSAFLPVTASGKVCGLFRRARWRV
ncbi:MAG TPA: hypothetical protein VNZ67_04685, partial [bacterium]|nr:hypothetical protein [bacterium]